MRQICLSYYRFKFKPTHIEICNLKGFHFKIPLTETKYSFYKFYLNVIAYNVFTIPF